MRVSVFDDDALKSVRRPSRSELPPSEDFGLSKIFEVIGMPIADWQPAESEIFTSFVNINAPFALDDGVRNRARHVFAEVQCTVIMHVSIFERR